MILRCQVGRAETRTRLTRCCRKCEAASNRIILNHRAAEIENLAGKAIRFIVPSEAEWRDSKRPLVEIEFLIGFEEASLPACDGTRLGLGGGGPTNRALCCRACDTQKSI
jgi:hypothetical protein